MEGQVELLGDLGIGGHGVKELLPRVPGVAGHEANEEFPVQGGDGRQQVRKIPAPVQVLAVGIDILAQEGDLPAARGDQLPALLENFLRLAAPLPAPDIGDDAVGTEIIAAVHDGDPRLQRVVPHHGQALGNGPRALLGEKDPFPRGEDPVQDLGKAPQLLGIEDPVHMGIALFQPLHHSPLAGHAAAQENLLLRVAAFGVLQRPQVAKDPLLGVLPDGAGDRGR